MASTSATVTKSSFARALLRNLGIRPSPGAVKALVGWQNAEGGHWDNSARYNPLNTTLRLPGSIVMGGGNVAGVQAYQNWRQGLHATAQTLKNYPGILRALEQGNPGSVAAAIGSSPWGTNGQLVRNAIASATIDSGGTLPGATGHGGSRRGGGSRVAGAPAAATTAPGVDPAARQALLLNYVENRSSPDALLNLAAGLNQLNTSQPAAATYQQPAMPGAGPSSGGSGSLGKIVQRANIIDSQRLPYQWGGGHAGTTPIKDPVPLDCSGAVSKVLGINPRVSGQFESWGAAGRGQHITIYANGHHVLMEIDGHFFGTSQSNPGGGAGWIPRAAIPASYLSQFVARHPPGM